MMSSSGSSVFVNVLVAYLVLFACGEVSDSTTSSQVNDIQRIAKDDGNFRGKGEEVSNANVNSTMCWVNINKEVDMALQMIWPVMVDKGYTSIELPDMTEKLSLTPLLLTYSARLQLTNGLLSNIDGISRDGDAMMTYHNKSFQFCLHLVIRNVEFIYNYNIGLIAIEVSGKVGGRVKNTALTGNFSISVETSNITLTCFQILSFGNIEIRLKHNSITSQLSGSLPRPLTDLFKDRIIAIVSDAVRIKLEKLIDDINENDRLHFKEFGRISLAGLLG